MAPGVVLSNGLGKPEHSLFIHKHTLCELAKSCTALRGPGSGHPKYAFICVAVRRWETENQSFKLRSTSAKCHSSLPLPERSRERKALSRSPEGAFTLSALLHFQNTSLAVPTEPTKSCYNIPLNRHGTHLISVSFCFICTEQCRVFLGLLRYS